MGPGLQVGHIWQRHHDGLYRRFQTVLARRRLWRRTRLDALPLARRREKWTFRSRRASGTQPRQVVLLSMGRRRADGGKRASCASVAVNLATFRVQADARG